MPTLGNTEAIDCYHSAIAALDTALAFAPTNFRAPNHKGFALLNLGTVYVHLEEVDDALQTYHAAIAAFDQSLDIAPDQPRAQRGRELAM